MNIRSIARRVEKKTTVLTLSYLIFHCCLSPSLGQREKRCKYCKEKVKLFFANGIILYLQIPESQLRDFQDKIIQ